MDLKKYPTTKEVLSAKPKKATPQELKIKVVRFEQVSRTRAAPLKIELVLDQNKIDQKVEQLFLRSAEDFDGTDEQGKAALKNKLRTEVMEDAQFERGKVFDQDITSARPFKIISNGTIDFNLDYNKLIINGKEAKVGDSVENFPSDWQWETVGEVTYLEEPTYEVF